MNNDEQLIGFDVRSSGNTPTSQWDEEKKAYWLIRSDILRPLSTDDRVWPSLIGRNRLQRDWRGFIQALWENLYDAVISFGSISGPDPSGYWVIAVTLMPQDMNAEEDQLWKSVIIESTTPKLRNPEWSLLGYDVSDRWLLSGLSDCVSVKDEDYAAIKAQFESRINRYHLFDDMESAIEFRTLSNQRVKEHAPFFVYGLWLIFSREATAKIENEGS